MPLRRVACHALLLPWVLCAQAGTLTLDGWPGDDRATWQSVLIPAFQRRHPDIRIRLAAGTGRAAAVRRSRDLLACEPGDDALALHRQGLLEVLDGKVTLDSFSPQALSPWQDGKTTFCLPVASTIHGFLYNQAIFRELRLQPPGSEAQLLALLEAVRQDGRYLPLAVADAAPAGGGVACQPTGRSERLASYLAGGRQPGDGRRLFLEGRVAIYLTDSPDALRVAGATNLDLGVFPPPAAKDGDRRRVCERPVAGIAIDRRSRHKEQAYKFLNWVGSQEFADLYTNHGPGYLSLSSHLIAIRHPLLARMADWRRDGTGPTRQ